MWIYTKRWGGQGGVPIGLVFLLHGVVEHINRPGYIYLANKLVESGYAVFGMDHIGHGRSNGSRSHVTSIDDLSDDYETFVLNISKQHPDLPRFAIGHSMGGLVLLNLVKKNPKLFNRIILNSPAVCEHLNPNISETLKYIGHNLSLVFPKLQAVKLDLNGITNNNAALETYLKDPLINQGYLTLWTGDAIVTAGKNLWGHIPEIILPVLIIHGKADTIIHPKGSILLYERLGTPSSHKKIYLLDNVKHEPWEDFPKIDEIIFYIKEWLV